MSVATYDRVRQSGQVRPIESQPLALAKRSQSVAIQRSQWPKRSRKRMLGLVGAVLAAAGASYQTWKSLSDGATAPAEPAQIARHVKVDRPAGAAAASVVLPATIRPWQTTTLHSRVSGYLKAWHQDLGARVKAGEVLAEIDTPELDQELAEGKALAREAAAAAVQAKAERTEAEADLKVAEGQLASQVELKPVRLGRDLGARVVVLEGIQGDEQLVVNPGDDLTNGVRVQISERREPEPELAKR